VEQVGLELEALMRGGTLKEEYDLVDEYKEEVPPEVEQPRLIVRLGKLPGTLPGALPALPVDLSGAATPGVAGGSSQADGSEAEGSGAGDSGAGDSGAGDSHSADVTDASESAQSDSGGVDEAVEEVTEGGAQIARDARQIAPDRADPIEEEMTAAVAADLDETELAASIREAQQRKRGLGAEMASLRSTPASSNPVMRKRVQTKLDALQQAHERVDAELRLLLEQRDGGAAPS
tara:strand:+ start:155 stop:856 length:702 start_codon:yes stop_codon:yes gene_type:complete